MASRICSSKLSIAALLLVLPLVLNAEPKKVRSIEGITEYRLDNGLQVLLFPDQSKPKVTVNITYFVGSRHEGYGETGMAHLLEHMVFKGTPLHRNIPKALTEKGASFNGTTWLDRTNYYETLPASDENLEFAIRLEADRMINSFIKGEDLQSEMTVVRNEFERGENSPNSILMQRMFAVAFEWHNYGKSTIGNRSDIERVPIQNLRAFYRKHYQPDNAMLVVAGKFKPEKALELVQKYFGSIKKPERVLSRTYTEEPPQDGERKVVLRRVGDVSLVGAAYHIPPGGHPDFAAVDVMSSVLTTQPAGRLYKKLVETKKAASVSGGAFALHDPGIAFFFAEVRKNEGLDEVRSIMLSEIESLAKNAPTQEEVARVKQQALKDWELSFNQSSDIAVELSEWAAQGDWRLFFLYRDRIEKVSAADVQAAAAKYLQANNRTVGMFYPTKKADYAAIPTKPDLTKVLAGYKGRTAVVGGEAFNPAPLAIEARTERTKADAAHLLLLPKKTRGEAVVVKIVLRYGDEHTLKGLETACSVLPALMARGTSSMNYQQLRDELDKEKAALSTRGSAVGRMIFSVTTKRENLKAVLNLLRQIIREPALPESELSQMLQRQIAGLESMKSEPDALAPTALQKILNPYKKDDIRYKTTIEEDIKRFQALKVEDVKKVYDNFVGAGHAQIAVVGDFDPGEVKGELEKIVGKWQSDKSYSRIGRLAFTNIKGQRKSIKTPGKKNAVYMAGMVVPMSDSDPDYPALVIGNFILGGGSLSSRLADRVRQKDGLSYGVQSIFRANALDAAADFMIYAISNPANSEKVVKAIREELDQLLKDGITEDELKRAKAGYLQGRMLGRTSDSGLGTLLINTVVEKRSMAFHQEYEDSVKALTVDQVNKALRKHIKPNKLVIVTAGDFK